MTKKIINKVVFNKRTGQMMIFPSKKALKVNNPNLMKASNPKLKFQEDLFVRMEFFRKKKKK